MPSQSVGLAVLAGIAACVRDAPGKAQIIFGADRAPEPVYLRGHAGRSVLGRWYDKALEAGIGPGGSILRGEDQRRWAKGEHRDPAELTAEALRSSFQRRFYPLWKAPKGVTVRGPVVVVEKLRQAVQAGEITLSMARVLAGDLLFEAAADLAPKRTRNRLRPRRLPADALAPA